MCWTSARRRSARRVDAFDTTSNLRSLARQAVLDAGYEEDMFISNTKIGARSAAAWRARC